MTEADFVLSHYIIATGDREGRIRQSKMELISCYGFFGRQGEIKTMVLQLNIAPL